MDDDMDRGRLLIRNGRSWLKLTEADIERGAKAVVSDPHYRAEIARSAVRHAAEIGDLDLGAAVTEAWARLDEFDGGEKNCHGCALERRGRAEGRQRVALGPEASDDK